MLHICVNKMSREVLKPPIMRMSDNRCYRVNLVHEDFGSMQQRQTHGTQHGYVEKDLYAEDDDDAEEKDENVCIEEQANGTYRLAMHVAPPFRGGLIGFKGSTKRRIEMETQTSINVPPRAVGGANKEENITITGKNRSDVNSARRKINLLISSLRTKVKATHFVGIPLNAGEIRENFVKFKSEIMSANYPGIDESLWVFEDCLHLTITACILLDDAERTKAIQVLDDCRPLLEGLKMPINITVSGLEIMNDDPSSVRVLYAVIDAPELQKLADRVNDHFQRSGLAKEKHETVKLHMTLLNNRYRKEENSKPANSFDARDILKRFGDYHFGSTSCNVIALHVLGNENKKDMYYKITGKLEI